MREKIEERRAELQREFTTGQQALMQMDQQRAEMRQTLLRISGAIQMCDELLNTAPAEQPPELEPD